VVEEAWPYDFRLSTISKDLKLIVIHFTTSLFDVSIKKTI